MGPVIASVSLGTEHLFRLNAKNGTVVFAERLPHESLFLMAGKTQKNFKHGVPKEPEVALPRINLTFRHIERRSAPFDRSTSTRKLVTADLYFFHPLWLKLVLTLWPCART